MFVKARPWITIFEISVDRCEITHRCSMRFAFSFEAFAVPDKNLPYKTTWASVVIGMKVLDPVPYQRLEGQIGIANYVPVPAGWTPPDQGPMIAPKSVKKKALQGIMDPNERLRPMKAQATMGSPAKAQATKRKQGPEEGRTPQKTPLKESKRRLSGGENVALDTKQ